MDFRPFYKHRVSIRSLFAFCFVVFISAAYAQSYTRPVLPDTSLYGRYTSRTMHLLQESRSSVRNTVKILVYGQSISAQDWWLEVRRDVQNKFPDAEIIMENRSIGGFSTQYLYKTVEMDVNSLYPDLILLHIYGSNTYYDSVLYSIRRRTTAEIAIMTDHFTGNNAWSDSMSYCLLPDLAEKYKCDIINIRDPWKKYLKDNHLEPSELLKDEVHLNDFGNFLMAELVKPIFCFKAKYSPDPFQMQSSYEYGDFLFKGDTATLSFTGNKAEIIAENQAPGAEDPARIILDGHSPSEFPGCYFMTRPYHENGKDWPWDLPAMIRIRHTVPWINEIWTCTFRQVREPYTDFSFEIAGSVTGPDGQGNSWEDFVSPSHKVIIHRGDAQDGGDWHLKRSYQVLKTIVPEGSKVIWKTYSISTDSYIPGIPSDPIHENRTILFQGVENARHTLQIVTKGTHNAGISQIRTYRPYWGRKDQ